MDRLLVNSANPVWGQLISHIPTPATYADIASLALVAATSTAFGLRKYTWDKPDSHGHIYFERVQEGQEGAAGAKESRNINQRLQELVSSSSLTVDTC